MLNSPVWRGLPSWAFGAGLVAGGVVSALAVLVVGSLVRPLAPTAVWLVVAALVTLVLAVREAGLVTFRLPQNARLVPESVFRHGRVLGPFQFGLEMGTGVRTYVTSGLPYALVVAVAFLAGPGGALLAGLGFGLGRSLMTFGNLRFDDRGGWDLAFDAHAPAIRTSLFVAYGLSLGTLAVLLPG